MKKVYCKDCKSFTEKNIYVKMVSLLITGDISYVPTKVNFCKSKNIIITYDIDSCPNYKPKWYLFWRK